MQKDPYHILQIAVHAEIDVVEAAYRRLARKYHPDVNNSPKAKERMQELNWAYEVLKDPIERARFDRNYRGRSSQASYSSQYSSSRDQKSNTTSSEPPKQSSQQQTEGPKPESKTKPRESSKPRSGPHGRSKTRRSVWILVGAFLIIFILIITNGEEPPTATPEANNIEDTMAQVPTRELDTGPTIREIEEQLARNMISLEWAMSESGD